MVGLFKNGFVRLPMASLTCPSAGLHPGSTGRKGTLQHLPYPELNWTMTLLHLRSLSIVCNSQKARRPNIYFGYCTS